jgi:F-box and leucine-rich repeat protein 2/20
MKMEKRMRKRIRVYANPKPKTESLFEALSEELLFLILDLLDSNPLDRKSFSLVSRSFYTVESRHRRSITPLRSELLPSILSRYNSISHLNLTLCPFLTDASLSSIASLLGPSLRSIDLSGSRSYTHKGIEYLANKCLNLEEIDISNGAEFTDEAAVVIGRMTKVERVRMGRCKKVTDLGIGCVAVGCPKLKLLCLKGCIGLSDLGVALIAVKCRQLKSLDVSFTMVYITQFPLVLSLSLFCLIEGTLFDLLLFSQKKKSY